MKTKIIQALNSQLVIELESAYLYLGMAAYADSQNLKGFAHWFKVQAAEELDHARGLYEHLVNRGAKVSLNALTKPLDNYAGIKKAVEAALDHEKLISRRINELFELSQKEKDYALSSFLKWYIDEQVEEEAHAEELLAKLAFLGDKGQSLYLLDRELSSRKYKKENIS